ncbi:MAG: ferrous iron transport protein A [Spirulinaceae cyanobacterium SM2_1_0]|nr:ferrous iron transport protein A [Spirulinaceae cyanobacterium SM2_1_0]
MSSCDESTKNGAKQAQAATWRGFTYLGVSSLQEASRPLAAGSRTLAEADVGDRLCIVALNCGESNRRLHGMGLTVGCELQVISQTGTGSVIVSLGDRQLGLAAEIASRIQVIAAELYAAAASNSHHEEANSMPAIQSKLRDAPLGARLRVVGYDPTARAYKHKLLAMGLTPGTEFTVTRHAPLGDPTEIEVRGYQLSLRKSEADALQVAVVNPGDSDA